MRVSDTTAGASPRHRDRQRHDLPLQCDQRAGGVGHPVLQRLAEVGSRAEH
jgi:hypothetical protein